MPASRSRRKQDQEATGAIEWVIAAVSALLVAGLLGFLAVEAVTATGAAPRLEVVLEAIDDTPEGQAALIGVRNSGRATAAAVEVAGEAPGPDGPRTARVTLDYVPAESSRRATLLFDVPVAPDTLRLRVVGFTEP